MGIDEHEQNGVTAPKIAARRFVKPFFPASHCFTFVAGKYDLKKPIREIKTNKSNKIFIES
jgi:hypothetical protein